LTFNDGMLLLLLSFCCCLLWKKGRVNMHNKIAIDPSCMHFVMHLVVLLWCVSNQKCRSKLRTIVQKNYIVTTS
jgi:hypothetical protein